MIKITAIVCLESILFTDYLSLVEDRLEVVEVAIRTFKTNEEIADYVAANTELNYLWLMPDVATCRVLSSKKISNEARKSAIHATDIENAYSAYMANSTDVNSFIEANYVVHCAIKAVCLSGSLELKEDYDDVDIKLYPKMGVSAVKALKELFANNVTLIIDIETTGLEREAKVLTIGISTRLNQRSLSVAVFQDISPRFATLFKQSLHINKPSSIYHNQGFDILRLIILCYTDMFKGLDDFYGLRGDKVDDTQVMAFLCLNSLTRPELSLKKLAYACLGDYAIDMKNNVEATNELATYNGMDIATTYFLAKKYYPEMLRNNQGDVYDKYYKPSQKSLMELELTGLPASPQHLFKLADKIDNQIREITESIQNSMELKQAINQYKIDLLKKRIAERKAKRKTNRKTKELTLEDIRVNFKLTSRTIMQQLMYGLLKLELREGKPTLQASHLLDQYNNNERLTDSARAILKEYLKYASMNKLHTSFLKPILAGLKQSQPTVFKDTPYHYTANEIVPLRSQFHLTRVLSGRISASSINAMQLPSNSAYGKDFKRCIRCIEGTMTCESTLSSYIKHLKLNGEQLAENEFHLLTCLITDTYSMFQRQHIYHRLLASDKCNEAVKQALRETVVIQPSYFLIGVDFNSIEDKVSALQSNDINKLAIYIEGYDAHCFNAYTYFYEEMPSITQKLSDIGSELPKTVGAT